MFCRRCGTELPGDSQFCSRCGTPVDASAPSHGAGDAASVEIPSHPAAAAVAAPETAPPAAEPAPPPVAEPPPAPAAEPAAAAAAVEVTGAAPGSTVVIPHVVGDLLDSFTSPRRFWNYWRTPAVGAAVAVVFTYACALLTMGAVYALFPRDDSSPIPGGPIAFVLKGAGLLLGAFEGSALRLRGPGVETIRVVAIPMTGLLLVGGILVLSARWAARRHEGTPRQRMFAAIRMAVPYAVLMTSLSTLTTIVDGKETNDYFFAELSNRDILGYSLLWGAVFGCVGGALATRRWNAFGGALQWLESRVPGAESALSASRRGLVTAALLTFVGLLVAAGVYFGLNTDDFGGIFSSVKKSLAIVLGLVFFLPNYLVIGFIGAMGGTIVSLRTDESIGIFGASEGAGMTIPVYWWLAVLIPLVVTVRMGYAAARGSGSDPRRAFTAALLSVVPFAATIWVLSLLAGVSGFTATFGSETPFGLGSSSGAVFFLPVVWGAAGSTLGALLYLRSAGLAVTATQSAARQPAPITTPPGAGAPVAAGSRCGTCGAEVPPGSRFCEACGQRVQPVPEGSP